MSDALDQAALEAARTAYRKAEENPHLAACYRCGGRGYHHGFGEKGSDPDWCLECGGGGYDLAEGEQNRPLDEAIRAYLAARSVPEAGKAVVKVQHRVRPHKKAEWGPWTDGYVPKDYLGWFEQREVPTEIGWRDKRIEILTDECVRRSKQISEIAKQRNDAEIRAETAEAEATSLRRKLEEAERKLAEAAAHE